MYAVHSSISFDQWRLVLCLHLCSKSWQFRTLISVTMELRALETKALKTKMCKETVITELSPYKEVELLFSECIEVNLYLTSTAKLDLIHGVLHCVFSETWHYVCSVKHGIMCVQWTMALCVFSEPWRRTEQCASRAKIHQTRPGQRHCCDAERWRSNHWRHRAETFTHGQSLKSLFIRNTWKIFFHQWFLFFRCTDFVEATETYNTRFPIKGPPLHFLEWIPKHRWTVALQAIFIWRKCRQFHLQFKTKLSNKPMAVLFNSFLHKQTLKCV